LVIYLLFLKLLLVKLVTNKCLIKNCRVDVAMLIFVVNSW